MSQPTPYDRQNSFALDSSENPGEPHSGADLDAEFNAVKLSLDETQGALALIQRDDGALANGIVGLAQLAADVSLGVTSRGVWETATLYTADIETVFHTTKIYRAVTTHTSGVFATDLAAGKWEEIADLGVQVLDVDTVGTDELQDGAVTEAKLGALSVTAAKIGNSEITLAKLAASLQAYLVPAGTVVDWPGTSAPTGWLFPYGQVVAQATYPSLWTNIGTTFNTGGEGAGNFRLPDLRGRVVAGKDDMGGTSANRLTDADDGLNGDTLGDTGGGETQSLVTANHAAYTPAGTIAVTDNRTISVTNGAGVLRLGGANNANLSHGGGVDESVTITAAFSGAAPTAAFTGTAQGGTSQAFGVVQPTIILNKIIKAH